MLRLSDSQNSLAIIFMSFLNTYPKTLKMLWYRKCVFTNFYFLFTTIAGFSEYKPMDLFSGWAYHIQIFCGLLWFKQIVKLELYFEDQHEVLIALRLNCRLQKEPWKSRKKCKVRNAESEKRSLKSGALK